MTGGKSGAPDLSLLHESVQPLVELLVRRGAPVPIIGYEVAGEAADLPWMIEAAWVERQIGILIDRDPSRDNYMTELGWDVRHVDQWDPESLYLKVL